MISDTGKTVSVWMATADVPKYPVLTQDESADVCVVGGGIAGLTTANKLAAAGRSVIVLERGQIACGDSGRTTGHLSNAIDDRYVELERVHGRDRARLAAESHTAAIDEIGRICAAEGIRCGYERIDGFLFCAPGDDTRILHEELAAAHRAGLTDVLLVDRAPGMGFDTGPALMFPRQGQLHIVEYLAGLAAAITRLGGRIYMGTHVRRVDGGRPAKVAAESGATVACDAVVVATNTPINDVVTIHTEQAPYRTYAVGMRIPPGDAARALYWDTLEMYHYVRFASGDGDVGDLLIVGGEDHKTGQADEYDRRYAALENWTRERFPQAGPPEFRWSGQVMETMDYLAFIGRNPGDADNVFIATGDSGHGMTHGTLAGMILTDLILGNPNPWAGLYDPARVRTSAAAEWLRENVNAAAQYADYVTPGDVDSVDEIARGEGAVLRRGLGKVAAYRDEAGALHECSAVCTHAGGIVHWNAGEKCWECPVHGSRFDAFGGVVGGPAAKDLEPVRPEQPAPTQG